MLSHVETKSLRMTTMQTSHMKSDPVPNHDVLIEGAKVATLNNVPETILCESVLKLQTFSMFSVMLLAHDVVYFLRA